MNITSCLCIAATAVTVVAPQARPWVGTWRLDRRASLFKGALIHIDPTPEGYRFDLGAVHFLLPDDGVFHPTVAGRETKLLRLGEGRWEREHWINGRIVDRSILTLSKDSRTLTISGEHPGASPERLVKEGSGAGLAGSWRSTKLGINAANILTITSLESDRLRWGSPDEGNWYDLRIGGAPAVNTGPTGTTSATLQLKAAQDGSLRWIERVNGRPAREGTERESSDRQSMTETAWPVGAPKERQIFVYKRETANQSNKLQSRLR